MRKIAKFFLADAIKFFKMCSSEEECNQRVYFDSLIIEEFKRLQPAGVFQGSAHEADSLIHHIVSMMNSYPFLVEGLDGMTYNQYHVQQDTALCMRPSISFCENLGGRYEADLCDFIDTVRQCKVHLEPPMLLRDLPSHGKSSELPNGATRNRDASGKFLNKNTARKAKY